jgi:hypothetical protein
VQQVTKAEFRRIYKQFGSEANGWTSQYWDQTFEPLLDMTWHLAMPVSPNADRMLVVTDFKSHEIRMVFLDEEAEESFFRSPGNP